MRHAAQLHSYAALLLAVSILAGCTKDSHAPTPITTKSSSGTEEMVLTPAGYMPKSSTHFIEPGTELIISNGHIQKIESASRRMLQDFGPVTITQDPIHSINTGGGFEQSFSSVVPRTVNGWAAYTYWSNPTTSNPVTSFTTNWVVPKVPANQGSQTLFLFNGMQDGTTASSYIVQPVLQWGPSAAGGGKYWAITNWYVSSKQTFYGTLETVSTGTTLQGVMTETGKTGSNYNYTSSFVGYPPAQNISISNVPEAFWCAETLEVYGVSRSTQYPNQTSMPFSSIQILQGSSNASISWTPVAATGGALPKAVVNSDSSPGGSVTIDF
ncbi:MAG TPA: hypothetical protein VFE53_19580 [Mucilaginibacter sp.]|jgi:hypothetical protein|nr:hypothetical protein [Mucilaginibacter sp.]